MSGGLTIPPVTVADEIKPLEFVENVSEIVEPLDGIVLVYGVVIPPTPDSPLDIPLT